MKATIKNIILTIIVVLATASITTFAVIYTSAENITLDIDNTEKTNVKDSLDELYDMVPTHSNLSADGLIALNEMIEMDQPETEQLVATKDWRYTGANPNNYIIFNNEMWRIIGVFNVDDGTGTLEKRIKIIRSEPMQDYIAWDTSGANDWTTSSLKTYLNGDYYNSLTSEAKGQIKDAKWYLGGWKYVSYSFTKPSEYYNHERSTAVYSGNPINWTGTIALMYMSDYGFAVGGSDRETCLNTEMSSWNANTLSSCPVNDWIHKPGQRQWTVVPCSNNTSNVWNVYPGGNANSSGGNNMTYTNYGVRPSIYLKSDITLTGAGTMEEPYRID